MALPSPPVLAASLLALASLPAAQTASAAFRNGSGVNPAAYACDAPVLGAPWTAEVDRSALQGAFASVISIFPASSPGIPTPFGEILYDTNLPAILAFSEADPGSVDTYQFPFPNDMSLAGMTGYSQALMIAPGPTYRFCNAADLTPGSAPAAARPVAAFTSSAQTGLAPHAVTFTDQSSGTVTSWSWSFGDGSTSSQASPMHTYTTPGIYDVSLVVTGPGGFDVQFESEYVISGLGANAIFRNGNDVNPACYFSTVPVIGGSWHAAIDHTDRPSATFAVILLRTQIIPPFSVMGLGELLVGGTALLDLALPVEPDGYTDFTFNIPFEPSLMGLGTSQGIVVGPEPVLCNAVDLQLGFSTGALGVIADFTGGPPSGPAPHTVNITDLTIGGVATWLWYFGDGTTSTDQHPSHTYTQPGTYTVSLIVQGPGGFDIERKVDIIQVQ